MTQKQRYLIVAAGLFLLAFLFWSIDYFVFGLPAIPRPADNRAQWGLSILPVTMPDGTRIAAEVVITDKQKQIGLMYRNVVPPGTGMLFIYPTEDYHKIWMKNTFVPLDIIWIGENFRITYIAQNLPIAEPDTPDEQIPHRTGFGKYVLELAAGETDRLKLAKGSTIQFSLNE